MTDLLLALAHSQRPSAASYHSLSRRERYRLVLRILDGTDRQARIPAPRRFPSRLLSAWEARQSSTCSTSQSTAGSPSSPEPERDGIALLGLCGPRLLAGDGAGSEKDWGCNDSHGH